MDSHLVRSNTPPSKYEADLIDTQTTSKGNKRLFSHTFSEHSSQGEDLSDSNSCDEQLHEENEPFEKRHRTSDWPLGDNGASAEEDNTTFAVGKFPSPTRKSSDKQRIMQQRASKFIEGSMNNRVSQRPPATYVASQIELNHSEGKETTKADKPPRNKLIRHSNQSTALPEESKVGTARQSTIFRFGKSLAASFNPSNWKIWSRAQDVEVSDNRTRVIDHAELEKAYKDIKNLPPTPGRRPGLGGNIGVWDNAEACVPPFDSGGINAFGTSSLEQSSVQKRYGRVFVNLPSVEGYSRQDDFTLQHLSRSSCHTESSPLPSNQTLHNNGNKSSVTYGTVASVQTTKRIPSRQDLRAQQKLVKRVSTLEMKLEAARRELNKSLGNTTLSQQIQPRPHKFIPGALASLPSESLLSGHTHESESTARPLSPIKIGAALTTDRKISLAVASTHGETPRGRRVSGYDNANTLSAPANSNRELSVTTSPEDVELGRQLSTSTILHKRDGGYKTDATCDAIPNIISPTDPRSKKRKSIGRDCIGDAASHEPSKDLDGQDNVSEQSQQIPAKKARSHLGQQCTIELSTGTKCSNVNLESDDPEMPIGLVPPTQLPVSAQLSTRHEGNPKLIVKKRAPIETQGSRIPRKGSQKGTPSALDDENTMPLTGANATSKPARRRFSDEVPAFNSVPRHATETGQRKLNKVVKPGLTTSPRDLLRQVEAKELRKSKGKKLRVVETKMGTSSESFEWGSDVF